jgi:hypothetical protein
MPISASSLEGLIRGHLSGSGFALSGDHAKAGIAAKAVAVGVVGEVLATAKVIVPPRAGGSYNVTGLSESGMNTKITTSLSGQGVAFGTHGKANALHLAISSAVSSEILSKCSVAVPWDGSGSFQVVGLSQSTLEARIIGNLQGHGFNTSVGDCGKLANAVSKAVTTEINGRAVITGSFVGGGTFPVL